MIYALCVDPEHGKYLAFHGDFPQDGVISYTSIDDAIGKLVRSAGEGSEMIGRVVEIDVREIEKNS